MFREDRGEIPEGRARSPWIALTAWPVRVGEWHHTVSSFLVVYSRVVWKVATGGGGLW